jgi:hypothetical protein
LAKVRRIVAAQLSRNRLGAELIPASITSRGARNLIARS